MPPKKRPLFVRLKGSQAARNKKPISSESPTSSTPAVTTIKRSSSPTTGVEVGHHSAGSSSVGNEYNVPLSSTHGSPIHATMYDSTVPKPDNTEVNFTGSETKVSSSSTGGLNIIDSPASAVTTHDEINTPVSQDSKRYSIGSQFNVSLPSTFESSSFGEPVTPVLDGVEEYLYGIDKISIASTSAEDPLKIDLLQVACQKIGIFLRDPWICRVRNGCISVTLMSRKEEDAVQRRVSFSSEGKVSLSVHCKPLTSPEKFLGDVKSPGLLTELSLQQFVDQCIRIVNNVKNFEICAGYDHAEYKHVWSSIPFAKIDSNPYQECRYTETLRSISCTNLVPVRRWRCTECEKLRWPVTRRSEAYLKEKPEITTPNIALSEEQKLRKLEEQKKKLDACSRRLDSMEERLQKLLITDGVQLDPDLTDDLTSILKVNDLTPAHAFFLHHQAKASQARGPSGVRWHPDMIRFALALYTASPSAYATARDSGMIKLPSQRTLYDYTHVYDADEGIDEHILEDVSNHVSTLPHSYQKYHVLTCDEMHICRNLLFKKSTGEMLGYAKLSEASADLAALHAFLETGKSDVKPELASKMLSFMVKGVASDVKEVVASYSVNRLTTEFLYECTWDVINKCERSGVAIIAFVADGFSVNRSFMKKHTPVGVTKSGLIYSTLNKAAPERLLYFMSDVAHLLKTTRNCLYNSGFSPKAKRCLQKGGEKLVWQTIIDLFKSVKGNTLRKAYKLSSENVYINSFSAMKVKHAAVVLSKTVAKDIEDKHWPNTTELVKFIRLVNDWFDCLNGAHSLHGVKKRNKNLDPYTSTEDERFNFLISFLQYLSDWKEEVQAVDAVLNMTASFIDCPEYVDIEEEQGEPNIADSTPAAKKLLSAQTLDGIEFTVMAFIDAVKFLLNEGVQYVNARVFSQDHIEQHFSKQRNRAGGSANPTKPRFLQNNKVIHIQRQVAVPKRRGNTEVLPEKTVLTGIPLPRRRKIKDT